MYNRIKQIRKDRKLTQKEFGEIIGMGRDSVANIENNRVNPSEVFINLLCKEFNVNKEWLITGEGDPYLNITTPQDEVLADIFASITLNENVKLRDVIEKISKLDMKYLEAIDVIIDGLPKK